MTVGQINNYLQSPLNYNVSIKSTKYFSMTIIKETPSERLSKKWTVGWEAKLQEQMWIFGDNLSAEGIILQYNSKLQWGLFILQPSK